MSECVGGDEAERPSDQDLSVAAKTLAHPVRIQVLRQLCDGTYSPKALSARLDTAPATVSYHVRVLLGYEAIELVDTIPRRGSTEHFYRATDQGKRVMAMLGDFGS